MHAGLNLVYLVPGETGGMEIFARELIPELAKLPGLRLTAFVNQEAAEAGGGIGDPRDQGYLEHGGWSVLGVCRSSGRTQEVRPPLCQGRVGFAASTVKSRSP